MIAKEQPKKVKINITTYNTPTNKYSIEMNKTCGARNEHNSRFICSICLNTNTRNGDTKNFECDRRKSRSCPLCQGTEQNDQPVEEVNKNNKTETKQDDLRMKNVKVPKIHVDQGLNLLTEVLTVFQTQREQVKDKTTKTSRTIIVKDACVSTEMLPIPKPKLSISKIFRLSIEGSTVNENSKFYIVNSCQPKVVTNSQCSIDLIKHKSSSIPQMKMEELKNSLKEKTKTNKDAIEEVNRMFATVKREDNFDNNNRPLIRNGPRVLPVVKTTTDKQSQRSDEANSERSQKPCKCCQTKQSNFYMSSGDSLAKQERFEKSVNVECCNKNHSRNVQKDLHVCDRCRKPGFDSVD